MLLYTYTTKKAVQLSLSIKHKSVICSNTLTVMPWDCKQTSHILTFSQYKQ